MTKEKNRSGWYPLGQERSKGGATTVTVSSKGYIHETNHGKQLGRGKTTAHLDGDFHHHGNHAHVGGTPGMKSWTRSDKRPQSKTLSGIAEFNPLKKTGRKKKGLFDTGW